MRFERTRRLLSWLSVSFLLLGGATGCGSATTSAKPTTSVPKGANLMTLQGGQRQQTLENEARKEGQVVLWTTLAGPALAALGKAFEAKYPYIHVVTFRAQENAMITKAVQYKEAGRPLPDVFETPLDGVLAFQSYNLLQPFYTPEASSVPQQYKIMDKSGLPLAVTDHISYSAFGYNANLLQKKDLPQTLEDLTAPQFKGKLAMATSSTGVRWIGGVLQTLGTAQGEAFLQKMALQKVTSEDVSASALMGLIAGGQIAGSPAIFHAHELGYQDKGAPVGWLPLQPVVANVDADAIAKGASHPAAALLLVDFLLGPDGQAFFKKYDYNTPTEKQTFQAWVPETGLTYAQYKTAYTSWLDLFKKTFAP